MNVTDLDERTRGAIMAHAWRRLPSTVLRDLRSSPEFWQGFHDARPTAPFAGVIEDPTRPGGWCTVETEEAETLQFAVYSADRFSTSYPEVVPAGEYRTIEEAIRHAESVTYPMAVIDRKRESAGFVYCNWKDTDGRKTSLDIVSEPCPACGGTLEVVDLGIDGCGNARTIETCDNRNCVVNDPPNGQTLSCFV